MGPALSLPTTHHVRWNPTHRVLRPCAFDPSSSIADSTMTHATPNPDKKQKTTSDSNPAANDNGPIVIDVPGGAPVKAWVRGVPLEDAARQQLENCASMPFIYRWVAAMPDVHWGMGATVGSVIPTDQAIIPAAVGVDIGCGMMASRTTLTASDLPDNLRPVRNAIERAVPHGRTHHGGKNDKGSFSQLPAKHEKSWRRLRPGFESIVERHPSLERGRTWQHMGTLGSGKSLHRGVPRSGRARLGHAAQRLTRRRQQNWAPLHLDREERDGRSPGQAARQGSGLPRRGIAKLQELHRRARLGTAIRSLQPRGDDARHPRGASASEGTPALRGRHRASSDCHHNYVAREQHFGRDVWITRKGAVRAGDGDLGIIPGSMGARSYIVRGKGNPQSFMSCSHGAGRRDVANRGQAQVLDRQPRSGHRGRGVPQGRWCHRRDAGCVQVDRCGHGRASATSWTWFTRFDRSCA